MQASRIAPSCLQFKPQQLPSPLGAGSGSRKPQTVFFRRDPGYRTVLFMKWVRATHRKNRQLCASHRFDGSAKGLAIGRPAIGYRRDADDYRQTPRNEYLSG